MAAQFEIRQKDLKAARTILGNAIGRAPKDKVLVRYCHLLCLCQSFHFLVLQEVWIF
jgi:hypothetical protein